MRTEPAPRDSPRPDPAGVILDRLAARAPLVVALSGGVDSSVVAHLAFRALGASVTGVTLQGPAVSRREVADATECARQIGLSHVLLSINPLDDPSYRANPSNRCYFCRRGEASVVRGWGDARGFRGYVDGVHLDDLGDDRPGLRAMDEAGFGHPLVEAGWRKTEVRAYAREVGLSNWDRPSDACLASRVAHGQPISLPLLDRVQAAEEWFLAHGFRRVRVRTDGERARVEVDPAEVGRLLAEPTASRARERLLAFGFTGIELDPAGYRTHPGA